MSTAGREHAPGCHRLGQKRMTNSLLRLDTSAFTYPQALKREEACYDKSIGSVPKLKESAIPNCTVESALAGARHLYLCGRFFEQRICATRCQPDQWLRQWPARYVYLSAEL